MHAGCVLFVRKHIRAWFCICWTHSAFRLVAPTLPPYTRARITLAFTKLIIRYLQRARPLTRSFAHLPVVFVNQPTRAVDTAAEQAVEEAKIAAASALADPPPLLPGEHVLLDALRSGLMTPNQAR